MMFRDETVKVEKRVRASWGLSEASSSSSSSPSTSNNTFQNPSSKAKSSRSIAPTADQPLSTLPTPPASVSSTSPVPTKLSHKAEASYWPTSRAAYRSAEWFPYGAWETLVLHPPMATDPSDLGVSFYVNHYILGYPDEARRGEELNNQLWFQNPASQSTMAALGLAGLGNLYDDKRLQHLSKVKYGEALACTNEALRDPLKNLEAAIRVTIMLALFQVIALASFCFAMCKASAPKVCADNRSSAFMRPTSPTRTLESISWAAWP